MFYRKVSRVSNGALHSNSNVILDTIIKIT